MGGKDMPKDNVDSKKFIDPLNAIRATIIEKLKETDLPYYTWSKKNITSGETRWDQDLNGIKVIIEPTTILLDDKLKVEIADKIMVALKSRKFDSAKIDRKKIEITTSVDEDHKLIVNETYPEKIP